MFLTFKQYPNTGFCLLVFRFFFLGFFVGFFFFKQRSPLVLTQVGNQVKRCHLASASLKAAEQSRQPDPRLAVSRSPGPLRTDSANARGGGEESSQGLALLSAQSSMILQQQPQKCQLESKRLSKDVFQTLFVVTSAFYLVHFSRLRG